MNLFNIGRHLKRTTEDYRHEAKYRGFVDFRGEVEVIGSKAGKVFHYDKGDNTVTIWGKHAMMHILTGESFSATGKQRSLLGADHLTLNTWAGDSGHNNDGTMISNYQYFSMPLFPSSLGWWSRGDTRLPSASTYLYPYFPTKMLFGTGFEYASYNTGVYPMGSDFQAYYTNTINASTFIYNGGPTITTNTYSNVFGGSTGDSLINLRTVNDIYSTTLVTPVILDTDFGVPGAIKDGNYSCNVSLTTGLPDVTKLQLISGNYFPGYNYWGIGQPAFIYARREARFYQSGTEVALDFDSNVENKITYTITMPEQTGSYAGMFYPYNGFVLKVAGLFTDAKFFLRNTVPGNDAASEDSGIQEFKNYTKMPQGMLIAKRYIAPITKSHDVSITCRWSLYL
jgi:hypothetical protein